MSSSYISRTYVKTFLSTPMVDSLLSYGENTSQDAKLDLMISASSDTIDSFLNVAGYATPLTTVPASIQQACCILVINNLYASSGQEVPDTFEKQLSAQYAYLNLLRDKKLQLEGLVQNTENGTGGSVFTFNTADGLPVRIFGQKQLRGTFT